jgi:uncharacterized protein involved in type VI secretion and phage assembly
VTAAQQVDSVQVRGWDVTAKRAVVGHARAETTSATLGVTPDGLANAFGGGTTIATDVPYHRSQPDVDRAATALADRVAAAFAELDGVARGNPRLRAGTAVRLSLLGEPFDGRYTLTSTQHRYDREGGYTTAFAVSGRRDRCLLGLAGGGEPAARPVPGVVSAQVTDVNDPDGLGRVRLRFPWMSERYTTDWVRTVQAGAGADRGLIVLPETGDEVLVAFEQGDVRCPYVLGGLHNGVDRPRLGDRLVDTTSGAVRRRGFVSRNGHALVFLDDTGKDGIAVLTGDRAARVSLNQSRTTVRVHCDGTVEITGNQIKLN